MRLKMTLKVTCGLAGILVTFVGCQSRPTTAKGNSAAASLGQERESTPAQAAQALHDHYQKRDYDAIAPLIIAEYRTETLIFLKALDDVLAANLELREAVEAVYHLPSTEMWDLAFIENNLGVFSSRVQLINQKYRGDEAFVTLQEGENVPLIHARFVIVDGKWMYRPETAPPGMAKELHVLANVIRDVAGMVRGGAEYEAYLATFFTRAVPQIRKVLNTPSPGSVAAGSAVE